MGVLTIKLSFQNASRKGKPSYKLVSREFYVASPESVEMTRKCGGLRVEDSYMVANTLPRRRSPSTSMNCNKIYNEHLNSFVNVFKSYRNSYVSMFIAASKSHLPFTF